MSSHNVAATKLARARKPLARPVATAAGPASERSIEARSLAADIERTLADGHRDVLTTEAIQELMAAACKLYAAKVEAGEQILPCGIHHGISATEAMTSASGLLRAVNLAVFELGMWQSWTGR